MYGDRSEGLTEAACVVRRLVAGLAGDMIGNRLLTAEPWSWARCPATSESSMSDSGVRMAVRWMVEVEVGVGKFGVVALLTSGLVFGGEGIVELKNTLAGAGLERESSAESVAT